MCRARILLKKKVRNVEVKVYHIAAPTSQTTHLGREIPWVATASLGRRKSECRARSSREGLAGVVPVKVPLQKSVVAGVQLSTFSSSWHLGAVVASCNLDVEGLGPELTLRHIAIIVDRHHLGAEDVVAIGNLRGNGDALGVASIVEDGIGAPVSDLALLAALRVPARAVVDESALMNLEELKFGLVDTLAVAVAWGKVCCSEAVVGAVPSVFTGSARALMVPMEGHLGSSRSFRSVR
jgi:hypothetical protein